MIPYGIDHDRFHPDGRPREPFLLYPANAWPHKNHQRLFEAFALVRGTRPELRLVLTGYGHGEQVPAGVEVRGHVSLEEVADLYRSASALVFPSLYEGLVPAGRGNGRRLPGRRLDRRFAAGGLRRRRALLRPDLGRGDGRGDRGRARAAGKPGRAGARASPPVRLGRKCPRPRGRLSRTRA